MMKAKKVGLIVILILAGLAVGVFYTLTPHNMCSGGQSEYLVMTSYSFPGASPGVLPSESELTVSLKNEGTCNENLATSDYILCWIAGSSGIVYQPGTAPEGCVSLTPAQNSCLNPSVVSPNVTCQLTFSSFPTDEYCSVRQVALDEGCPWQFAFKVRTPTALFEYTIVTGSNT